MRSGCAIVLVCVLTLIAMRTTAADERRPACILIGAYGDRRALAVERGKEPLEPLAYLVLFEGDRLRVEEPGGKLVARCGDRDMVVTRDRSGWVVEWSGAAPRVRDNLLAWAREFLAGSSEEESEVTVTSVAVRSEEEEEWPLEIPLLTNRSAFLIGGRSELSVGWRGGRRPYAVRLYDADRRVVVSHAADILGAHVRLTADRPLSPGTYDVEVVDATGRYARGGLDVVEPSKVPRPPQSFASLETEDPVARTLRAAWMASAAEGIFALEAYQQASELAFTHQPARQLVNALRLGRVPTLPPAEMTQD